MSSVSAATSALGQQGQQNTLGDAFQDVGMDEFLEMMLAELKNQDPLDPMDNREILQQISQIREIVSNDRLTETLNAVFLGQNLTSASALMDDWVTVLSDKDNTVLTAGQVEQVSLENGIPKLHVGGSVVKLEDISQIQSEIDGQRLAAAMSMIGQEITGISEGTFQLPSSQVTGWVTQVSLSGGVPKLHVNTNPNEEDGIEYTIDPSNVIDDPSQSSEGP